MDLEIVKKYAKEHTVGVNMSNLIDEICNLELNLADVRKQLEELNKANEWHFVKDGDIPKDEDYKLCITDNGNYYIARYEELFITWSNQEHKEVCCPYAWKEIVLPKESEK